MGEAGAEVAVAHTRQFTCGIGRGGIGNQSMPQEASKDPNGVPNGVMDTNGRQTLCVWLNGSPPLHALGAPHLSLVLSVHMLCWSDAGLNCSQLLTLACSLSLEAALGSPQIPQRILPVLHLPTIHPPTNNLEPILTTTVTTPPTLPHINNNLPSPCPSSPFSSFPSRLACLTLTVVCLSPVTTTNPTSPDLAKRPFTSQFPAIARHQRKNKVSVLSGGASPKAFQRRRQP